MTKDNKEIREAKVRQVNKVDQVLLVDQGDQERKVKWDQRDFLDQLEGMDYLGDQAFLDHLDQLVNQERMEIREKLVYPVKKVLKAIKGPWVRLDQ